MRRYIACGGMEVYNMVANNVNTSVTIFEWKYIKLFFQQLIKNENKVTWRKGKYNKSFGIWKVENSEGEI